MQNHATIHFPNLPDLWTMCTHFDPFHWTIRKIVDILQNSPWFRRDFAKFLQVRRRQHNIIMISRKYGCNFIAKRRFEPIFRAGGSSGFLSQLFRRLITKSCGFFVVPRWRQLRRRVWQEPSRSSKSARRRCFMSYGQMIGFTMSSNRWQSGFFMFKIIFSWCLFHLISAGVNELLANTKRGWTWRTLPLSSDVRWSKRAVGKCKARSNLTQARLMLT